MSVKADFDLRNCALCGSDKIAMVGTLEIDFGVQSCSATIQCFSCGTTFNLSGQSKQDIIDLWNKGKIPQSVQ